MHSFFNERIKKTAHASDSLKPCDKCCKNKPFDQMRGKYHPIKNQTEEEGSVLCRWGVNTRLHTLRGHQKSTPRPPRFVPGQARTGEGMKGRCLVRLRPLTTPPLPPSHIHIDLLIFFLDNVYK